VVPAGSFKMGSGGADQGGQDDERPFASRQLDSFSIDAHEVTNAAYAGFLASAAAKEHTHCHADEPPGKDHTPASPSEDELGQGAVVDPFGGEGREQHPVVGVDWWDAYAYSKWAGRRLPSEDEWEKAARGDDGRVYPWGNQERDDAGAFPYANVFFGGDAHAMTAPVGSFPEGASPCGAQDMAGNVWEWTASPHLAYEGAPEGTPEDPGVYVIRGGGWNSASAFMLRAAYRLARPRDFRSAAVGFRTAGKAP
jgi:formylglycine-generating enzyme required for sulfatase activity